MGNSSEDGFALGRQLADVVANEFLEVGFATDEEGTTNASELMSPLSGHVQGELLDVLPADKLDLEFVAHASSSSLSWARNFTWFLVQSERLR